MLDLSYTTTFKKEFKKLQRNTLNFEDLKEFFEIIQKLQGKVALEEKYRDHSLSGNYKDRRDCHIKPDLVLIYKLDEENNKIVLERIGSHSELF